MLNRRALSHLGIHVYGLGGIAVGWLAWSGGDFGWQPILFLATFLIARQLHSHVTH